MIRYFYTDPLKAAWMAREFNFIINVLRSGEDLHVHSSIEILLNFAKYKQRKSQETDIAIYEIDLDCHDLLKPQAGDIIICDHAGEVREIERVSVDWCRFVGNGSGCNFAGIREIIQRNGKAFFSPES